MDAEEDETLGKGNKGYNLPEELRRREERLEKIHHMGVATPAMPLVYISSVYYATKHRRGL